MNKWLWAALLMLGACGHKKDEAPTPSKPPVIIPPVSVDCDDVYGQCVPRDESYYVVGTDLYRNKEKITLRGVNWFGLETSTVSLHGLWTGRKMEEFVDQMQGLGFNAFRIPVSPQALRRDYPGRDGYASPREQLEALLAYAEEKDMHVLLDMHVCDASNQSTNKPGPGLGICSGYTIKRWHDDLREMARLAGQFRTVVGIDIFNEPYGYRWGDWARLSSAAGEATLRTNPNILVFVEGTGNEGGAGRWGAFWGENFYDAGREPVKLPTSRLVYSPHVYGPSVAGQSYFNEPGFPGNMPAIWNEHFGYLRSQRPLVIGEWGGRYVGADQIWGDAFVSYLKAQRLENFFFWSMNPNSGDTGGILLDDWRTVDQRKLELIRRLF